MASSKRSLLPWLILSAAVSTSGCRSDDAAGGASRERPAPEAAGVTEAGTGGGSATPVPSTGDESGAIFELEPAGPSENDDVAACAGQVSRAEFVAVDLFIMLDISGSMLESTPAGGDKWTAIQGALGSFLGAPSSEGLGVGIQYFPLNGTNVPGGCSSDADCGGGSCMFDTCVGGFDFGIRLACQTDLECGPTALGGIGAIIPFGPCAPMAFCSDDATSSCETPGAPCVLDTGPAGTCELPAGVCSDGPICNADAYATPAVAIAALPDNAAPLLASINAQQPAGGTPSGPALRGAIQQAEEWATSHPGHTVAAVLATDGAPTDCDPIDIAGLSELAAAGFQGSPSVRTFAIGVFGAADLTAPTDLDSIARAGGTESAFVIDTTQDVSTRFLEALNTIRGTQLGCEFELPQPDNGGTLDFDLVNVDLTGAGGTTRIYRVNGPQDCGEGGWYYDDALSPSRIVSCPSTCDSFKDATTGTSVEIQVGCKTVLR